ncbi:MAG: SH3 domain-containing protein [Proteobacteria bacterium]|nr:SH3 domain-containing protein [Pseudomonadota bacterium]
MSSVSYAKIVTVRDIFIDSASIDKNTKIKTMIPEGTEVVVEGTKTSSWYQVFEGDNSKGYVQPDCVSLKGANLAITKICPLRSEPTETIPSVSTLAFGKEFKKFSLKTVSEQQIAFNGNLKWINSSLLKFIPEGLSDAELFEPAPIEEVVNLKKENAIISQYIDKTMYVSTALGVFMSYDAKKWYRIKKLESRKYEIAITQDGWLLADNLASRDYGKSFSEFFPSYAFPYKDSYVKSIMTSPQGNNAVYLTFSTRSDSSNITLFVLNRIEDGWKRIYPTVDGKVMSVPVEDTITSILNFINNKWINTNKYSKKRKLELEDINITGNGSKRTVSLGLRTSSSKVSKDYQVVLSLDYLMDGGWKIVDEKWRFI